MFRLAAANLVKVFRPMRTNPVCDWCAFGPCRHRVCVWCVIKVSHRPERCVLEHWTGCPRTQTLYAQLNRDTSIHVTPTPSGISQTLEHFPLVCMELLHSVNMQFLYNFPERRRQRLANAPTTQIDIYTQKRVTRHMNYTNIQTHSPIKTHASCPPRENVQSSCAHRCVANNYWLHFHKSAGKAQQLSTLSRSF